VDHAPPEGGDECRNFGRSHSARGRAFGSEPIRRLCREEGCAGREGCHLMDRVLVDPVPRSAGCMDERCWAGHAFVPRPGLPELSVGQQVTWRSPGGSSATIPAASSARAQGNDGICSPPCRRDEVSTPPRRTGHARPPPARTRPPVRAGVVRRAPCLRMGEPQPGCPFRWLRPGLRVPTIPSALVVVVQTSQQILFPSTRQGLVKSLTVAG
jgi:hypothetical protein